MVINNFNSSGFKPLMGQINLAGIPQNAAQEKESSTTFVKGSTSLDRRFDTFASQVSQDFITNIAAKIESNLMDVMNMSVEDRRYMANMHQANMKSLTEEAIRHEEEELAKFKDLKEQKEHYQSVLNNGGYITKGKFALDGINKKTVSKEHLQGLLADVQSKIDDIVTAKVAKESDPLDTKTFEYTYSAAMYFAATSTNANQEVLIGNSNSSIGGQWSRTEQNFEEESKKSVESLQKRLKDIDKMHNAFRRDGGFEERVKNEGPYEKQEKCKSMLMLFNGWGKKALLKLEEMKNIDVDALMKPFEKIFEDKKVESKNL